MFEVYFCLWKWFHVAWKYKFYFLENFINIYMYIEVAGSTIVSLLS
jgi:hypothetical protein